jgi:hypothetical protein
VRLTTIRLAVVGCLVGLVLAGCGGGSSSGTLTKAEYLKQMRGITADLSTSVSKLGAVTDAKSAADDLRQLQDQLRKTAKKLDDMKPPAAIKRAHADLAVAATKLAGELGPIITKLDAGDMTALAGVTSLPAFKSLQAANQQLSKAGYDLTG